VGIERRLVVGELRAASLSQSWARLIYAATPGRIALGGPAIAGGDPRGERELGVAHQAYLTYSCEMAGSSVAWMSSCPGGMEIADVVAGKEQPMPG